MHVLIYNPHPIGLMHVICYLIYNHNFIPRFDDKLVIMSCFYDLC